jgi:hypothetical protein
VPSAEPTKPTPKFSWELIIYFVSIVLLTLLSFFIAKAFASFGVLALAILIDFILYSLKKRPKYRGKYLPFLWWLAG